MVVTTNSSCEDFVSDVSFELRVNNQTLSPKYSCKQIPSGFSFALMCEIDNILSKVNEIILIARNDVFLLELEFYGYQSYTCLTPVDINKGITSLGEEIEENIHLKMGNETYTNIEHFKNSISQSNHLINTPHITYFLHLASLNCFHATVPVTITFTPGEAVQLIVVQNYLEIDSCSLNISIPIICVDPIGFIVKCFGNLTIMSATFNFTRFQLFTNELQFLSHQCFNIDYNRFEFEFSRQMSEANLTFIQKFAEILKVDTYDVLECSHQMLFEKSCTVLKPYVTLITQHHLSNTSSKIPLSALEFTSIDDHIVLVVLADSVEINSFPLQSMSISISYLSQSVTLKIRANDCHFPKLNSGHGCLCSKGMEFNSLGECVECALNYYTNSEFNSECRSCIIPRITLQKGSSHLDQCICPLNTLDSIDSCLPCPHLAECGYGNLTGIEPGFRLKTDTWELDECDIWFNCHENSCRSRHAYGDLCQYCTEDAISKRIYCIGKDQLLSKLLLLLLLATIIILTDISTLKYLKLKQSHHGILLLSKFQRIQVIRSMSRFINLLFGSLFSVSLIFTKSTSSIVVFLNLFCQLFNLTYLLTSSLSSHWCYYRFYQVEF
ncbi:hypothetical protein GEMRC1_008676 [Eukaryota sp. GEM-RC1]